jgi:serine phosphatase RsbU (regulator of sigma subunit)
MKVKLPITLLALIAFTFVKAQKTKADTLSLRLKDPTISDTVKLKDVVAYTFMWPQPSFNDAIRIIDEAYAYGEKKKLTDLSKQLLGRKIDYFTRNNRGMEAFAICQEMLKLGEREHNDRIIAESYNLRGGIFASFNMLGKAAEEQAICNEYYLKAKDYDALSTSRYLLAYYSFNNQDYETALRNFIPAYNYVAKNRKSDIGTLGEYSGWIGNAYSALKKFDSALYYRRLSINYFNTGNEADLADPYRYLGNVYRNMKLYDSAMTYYKRSYDIFDKYKMFDRKWLLQYFIAETHAALKDYKSSAKELDNLLDTITGTKDLLSLYLGNGLGGKVYDKNKEYQKAIACFKKYIVFKDSVEKNGEQGAVTELDAKLKFEKEENALKIKQAEKDALAKQESEKQALIRNFFIGGFAIMSVFLVVIFRNYRQKKQANKLLERQKNEIEIQKKEIQDSINYAQNIQHAVLPETKEIEKHFDDMFVLYKPKDVVSGDFFWFSETKNTVLLAAADCTGHGVPGAIMSMIGSYELNNSVLERGILQPSKILSYVNISFKKRLKQNEALTKNKDGMDIVLCSFDKQNMQLQYAGANRPLFIIRNNEPIEVAPTKTAIGGYTADEHEFGNNIVQLQKGDCVYMYTDGYADQFGGDKNKKLTTKIFKNFLLSIASKSMKEQCLLLEEHFYKWKGNFDQLDDVLVIGVRV